MRQPTFNHMIAVGLVGILSLLSQPTRAAPTFFKCTAASGTTQYAQRPINGQKCNLIRVDGTPASALELQRTSDQRNLARAGQSLPTATAATNPVPAASPSAATATTSAAPAKPERASAAQCEQLSQARATLEQGGRVYESDAQGERSYLTEEQRQARITEYQNTAKTRCP